MTILFIFGLRPGVRGVSMRLQKGQVLSLNTAPISISEIHTYFR